MNAVNGELLALFEAERRRERDDCIATIEQVQQELLQHTGRVMSFAEAVELMIERIRCQP